MKTCCFTGHRALPKYGHAAKKLEKNLIAKIEFLVINDVTTFIAGGAYGFDMFAANVVINLKTKFPQIKLIIMLPCKDSDKYWTDILKEKQQYILANTDKVEYISESYNAGCMHKRNRAMIDNSHFCIAYLTKQDGGTYYTVKYAKEKGIPVVNLAEN